MVVSSRRCADRCDMRLQLGEVLPTGSCQGMAGLQQLRIPGTDDPFRRFGPQRGVSLLQRPLVPPPLLHEPWFHVEHSPIQVASALLRALLDQPMYLGVDRLHRQDGRQLGEAADPVCPPPGPRTPPGCSEPPLAGDSPGLEATR